VIRARIFGAPADPDRLHWLVIVIATVVAALSVAAFASAWITTGEGSYASHMLGPGVAGSFFGYQLLRRRPNAFSAMVVGGGSIIGAFAVAGRPDTAVGSAIALVYVGVIGTAFVRRRIGWYLAIGALVLACTPLLWRPNLGDAHVLITAIVMSASFAVGGATLSMVRANAARSEERYRELFESAPVGLIEQDWTAALRSLEGRLRPGEDARPLLENTPDLVDEVVSRVVNLRANRAAGTILGSDPARLTGSMTAVSIEPEARPGWIDQIVALHEGRTLASFELHTVTTGRQSLILEGEILVAEAGRSVLVAFKDVTGARLAARSLEDLVKAKDQFIATVSHELRTPLTAVLGLTQELRSGRVDTEAERSELLALVAAQSTEVAHLVEDLLVGARADIGTVTVHPEPIDLLPHIDTVLEQFQRSIRLESPERPVVVMADPLRVRQILRNLVSNSLRYGGAFRRITLTQSQGTVALEMRDSGRPLSGDDQRRVFEPYERAHERWGITASVGLGLAVSRQLARLMDGDLVYLHDGETVFRLTLPAAVAAAPSVMRVA
jgi:signal transduction histidine kinase